MASTKRKRRTKHRGTPAGTIEARGRTGRKPRPEERAPARPQRANRFDKPPTWQGATTRAGIAAGIFLLAVVALFGQPVRAAVPIAMMMFVLYIPLGYMTDSFLYKRRNRRKDEG